MNTGRYVRCVNEYQRGQWRWFVQDVERIPFRTINLSNPSDQARPDRMVTLVTQMLESISDLKARNGFREELIRVLRWLNNSGFLPRMAKTALRRNRQISSRKLQDAKLDHKKTVLSRQIEVTDASIDRLVYELYGLTEEEIVVVEGRT